MLNPQPSDPTQAKVMKFLPLIFLFMFAISYHLINGIRYLLWSIGYGINMKNIYLSGYIVIIISTIATIQFWILIFYN